MAIDRVQFQDIVASQLPRYVREDFPLLTSFLEQYYVSQEYQGGVIDLVSKLDQYVKVDELFNLKNSTILLSDISYGDTTITASSLGNFTDGFPETNGLIKIDNEIIRYEYKTDSAFVNCSRGFSGITSYTASNQPDQLVFSTSEIDEHSAGATIYNLNILFLQEFFKKLKKQVVPGFSDRSLYSQLDQRNFIYNADSFYKSKGTDESFEILFRALYGVNVDVIKPSEYLLRPSDANYRITQDLVVEKVIGDPLDLKNLTLFQDQSNARGSVTNVEQIQYDQGQYYQISIDYGYQRDIDVTGTVYSQFIPNPVTKLLNSVSTGSTIVDVDSTVGFASTGTLLSKDADGNAVTITYLDKTDNQFLNVSGISASVEKSTSVHSEKYAYAYVGINTTNKIEVRITSTLKDLKQNEETYLFKKGDTISIQSIGIEKTDEKSKNWLYNVKTKWTVESVTLLDATENTYEIRTYDDVFLAERYRVNLKDLTNDNSIVSGTVKRVTGKKTFWVDLSTSINVGHKFEVENQLLKGNSTKYTNLNDFVSNVQNVYTNSNGDYLVASNSIPNYNIQSDPYDKKVTFSGSFNGTDTLTLTTSTDHGFYTGDTVWYKPAIIKTTTTNPDGITITTETENKFSSIDEGIYYVKRVDENKIKLSRSQADLFSGTFVSLTGDITNNQLIYYVFYNKEVSPQRIYRSIKEPVTKSGNYSTVPGYTGMLINGVEILNYKSIDTISYGDILSFEVSRGGSGYDVINPPVLHLSDQIGTGATGSCCVTGSLQRIDIIDSGFDYVDTPIIKISGGNGTGAAAEPNMSAIVHSVSFNAELGITTTNTTGVGVTNDVIGFSTFHKFAQNEKVVYVSNNLTNVGGLSTGAFYYVGVVDDYSIKLHTKFSDANSGINTVNITSLGSGVQSIRSSERKNIVSSIVVTNPGTGYQNKQRTIPTAGVSTALNQFKITNHGYKSKEIIRYNGTNVSGLSTNKDYYVVKVDDNTFSLTEVGSGNTSTDYYYNNKIIVDILSEGTGSFNYKPITVSVEGNIGVTTSSGQNFSCIVQPVFRGTIESVDLTSGGVGYGSSEVINFNRQPDITLKSGESAQLIPVVNNGIIVDVIIQSGGNGYNSPPDIKVNSATGKHAALTPILNGGKIVDVVIAKGGIGYSSADSITITAAGSGAIVSSNIRTWNVNLFERNFDNIKDDDGFVSENIADKSLEYCHIYTPRELRRITYSVSGNEEDNTVYGNSDLTITSGFEADSKYHSPIIGWAYDGNPIYGPFGFLSVTRGTIARMTSGYELQVNTTNRPPTSIYPAGFFVEDYVYTGTGSLDENNGRYCITPDFPNGVYAYFTTINSTVDSSGPFKNYRRPVFPYIIGNQYNSQPNDFNFRLTSNQNDYNIQNTDYLRCTQVYHTNDDRSGYDYIFNSKKEKSQTIDVSTSSVGTIESIGIVTGGTNYKINDRVDFANTGSGGRDADVRVSRIGGKEINTISVASTNIYNVEFIKYNQSYIGFAATPHGLLTNDIVSISGISTYFKGFNGSYTVGVRSDNFVLTLGIGTTASTGDVAYMYVAGALGYPNIRPNDILTIGTERVKVLNVDPVTQRIRVLRAQDGTVGIAHSSREILYEDPRKFTVNIGGLTTSKTFTVNRALYFDPAESVGTGTATGVGIGTTIVFSNPGVGATQVFVPTRAIYLPNHNLKTNDILTYSSNGGTPLYVWTGAAGTSYNSITDFQFVYAAPITNDLVGISSNKVGMGSTGYVGINTTTNLLYFTNTGVGDTHSFTTNYENIISGQVSQNIVTVSTATTHGLTLSDRVFVKVKPIGITTVTVKYDDYNRRIVFDPKDFTTLDVDVANDTISFDDEYFNLGDRVIHTSSSPAGGLVDEKMYYVIPYNETKIRLVENYFEITAEEPKYVNITSASGGTLSKINPLVKTNRNNKLKFDLSDSSLSFVNNSTRYSAFNFNLYSDKEYKNHFLTSGDSRTFEVSSSGNIGIDTEASVTLNVTDGVPTNLYYKFTPTNLDVIPTTKNEISIDSTISNFNEIEIVKTAYDGNYQIVGLGTTTFSYNVPVAPEVNSYNLTDSNSTYQTSSTSASGPITQLKIYDGGKDYKSLPGISSVISGVGSGAILEAQSRSIGRILSTKFDNIGFDYPTDNTVRVVANIPENLKIDPLTSFDRIGISSAGKNYLLAPGLIVIDGFTDKIVNDVDLKYKLGDPNVTISKNTFGISNTTPKIIPINNTNGVGISSLTYNSLSKVVRLYLNAQFSDAADFPFAVGENILVENIAITPSTGKGYNSKSYNYTLFPVTAADSQLGGSGAYVEYNLDDYLASGDGPGDWDSSNSIGRVIPEKDFPIFDITLRKNNFLVGETVISDSKIGKVDRWDPLSEYLIVATEKEFDVGTKVIGQSSNTQGVIKSKLNFSAEVATGAGATVIDGWQSNSGFLNDNLQRLPNNEYYQTLSYSLKSSVPYATWDDAVSSMNHTAGFAKFADYVLESKEDTSQGVVKSRESGVDIIVDVIGVGNLNCVYDFDYATETTIDINGVIASTEVIFENGVFVDYFESIGNRVLSIDDISGQFNSNERLTPYGAIGDFPDNVTYTKIFNYVEDINLASERQATVISLIQKNEIGYIQNYATIETGAELGYYDYEATTSGFNVNFHPNDYEFTRYGLSSVCFDIFDNTTTGVGSTTIGATTLINSYQTNVAAATTTTIVSISSTYRASKVLVQLENNEQQYTASELNILHDDTDVYVTEFGDLSVSLTPDFVGFGTFNAYIDGSQVKVDFIPNVAVALTANANVVSIANSDATGVSSVRLDVADITSHYASIAASGSPTAVNVASYHDPIQTSYNLVSVEDLTNNEYEMFEAILLTGIKDEVDDVFVEFANMSTGAGLGTVGMSTDGGTHLTFTPEPNIDVEVRTYSMGLLIYDANLLPTGIGFTNTELITHTREYRGTRLDLVTEFGLKHDGLEIFRRSFDGGSTSIVDLTGNFVRIPEHFFVTGEKVTYQYSGEGTTNAIGIATTTVPGVGSTDKLPTELYIVKNSDANLRFAATAEEALRFVPNTFDLTSVGIGTSHSLTSANPNPRVMVAVDNIIQSPIISTGVTHSLSDNIVFDTTFTLSGVSSIFADDLIQIDNELMLVLGVGVGGANNVSVRRAQMGTQAVRHFIGSEVTKISGNYNISGNSLHFTSPPYGNVPIGTTSDGPSNLDWTGITTSSTFQGRTFLRSAPVGSSTDTYSRNYVFDDISRGFTGVSSQFTLASSKSNVAGFSTDNAIVLINGIFQLPQGEQPTNVQRGDYDLEEGVGITTITFTGSSALPYGYDPNNTEYPVGGFIVSVGSTEGFGYQPLVSAGGTAIVSGLGTISSISIGNSGSGYRAGIQTVVNVGVQTYSAGTPNIEFIGTAAVSGGHIVSVAITNPGTGYTSSNPPEVVFDAPLPYSNVPLVYSSSSTAGSGQSATVNMTVGQGSSVIDFEFNNYGYGYGNNEILTVDIGGVSGIPTDTTKTFNEFQITVDRVFNDSFGGWNVGQLQVIDALDDQFDGYQTAFTMSINGDPFSAKTRKGSNVELVQTLLVFINDILQEPGRSYTFKGGSLLKFNEAPKAGDISKILFYKGTDGIDVTFVDVIETLKIGDDIKLNYDPEKGQTFALDQDPRVVIGISTVDSVTTNVYEAPGVTTDRSLSRPVVWCKQTVDKVIDGQKVGKDRVQYEPQIYPLSYVLKSVGISTDTLYVDSVRPLFDSNNEASIRDFQDTIVINSQDVIVGASATAVVSAAGTVSSLTITNPGFGYTVAPEVTIANPVGLGSTQRASATASISGVGTVSSLTITGPGTGYTSTNPPVVLIGSPNIIREKANVSSYAGDDGIIVGVGTTVSGAQDQFFFDLFIPMDSFMRNASYVGSAVTISGISTSDYLVIYDTDISIGSTFASQNIDGSSIGIGTTFIDCVYQVADYETRSMTVSGIGATFGTRIFVNVDTVGTGIGTTTAPNMGTYSWGKIVLDVRTESNEFNFYGDNGVTGISTSAVVTRFNSLKFKNYIV